MTAAIATTERQTSLLAELRRLNPGMRFAASADGAAVGNWVEALGMFRPVVMATITGEWVWTNGFVPLLNGERVYGKAEDWTE